MAKVYNKEELIYSDTKDISDISNILNNIIRVRIIRRVEIKPRNLFRRQEKRTVYYDIEFYRPKYHYLECEDTISAYVNSLRREDNAPRRRYNNIINNAVSEIMWKAENFCLEYKTDKCDNGIIRKIYIY